MHKLVKKPKAASDLADGFMEKARSKNANQTEPLADPKEALPDPAQEFVKSLASLPSTYDPGATKKKRPRKKVSRRPAAANGDGVSPYMDVITVNSSQFPSVLKDQSSDHAKLLVEPVAVPNLEHTGVLPATKARDAPLFYPNGAKNCNLRDTIKESLRTSVSSGLLHPSMKGTKAGWEDNFSRLDRTGSMSVSMISNQPSQLKKSQMGSVNNNSTSSLSRMSKKSTSKSKRGASGLEPVERLPLHGVNARRSTESEMKTKELIAQLRGNSEKMSHLVAR